MRFLASLTLLAIATTLFVPETVHGNRKGNWKLGRNDGTPYALLKSTNTIDDAGQRASLTLQPGTMETADGWLNFTVNGERSTIYITWPTEVANIGLNMGFDVVRARVRVDSSSSDLVFIKLGSRTLRSYDAKAWPDSISRVVPSGTGRHIEKELYSHGIHGKNHCPTCEYVWNSDWLVRQMFSSSTFKITITDAEGRSRTASFDSHGAINAANHIGLELPDPKSASRFVDSGSEHIYDRKLDVLWVKQSLQEALIKEVGKAVDISSAKIKYCDDSFAKAMEPPFYRRLATSGELYSLYKSDIELRDLFEIHTLSLYADNFEQSIYFTAMRTVVSLSGDFYNPGYGRRDALCVVGRLHAESRDRYE